MVETNKIDDLDWLARQAKDLYHSLDRHDGRNGLNQRVEFVKNMAFARWQRRAKALRKAIKEEHRQ